MSTPVPSDMTRATGASHTARLDSTHAPARRARARALASTGRVRYLDARMRSAGFGALTGVLSCLAGACIPVEPEWVVTDPRFRGVKVEVVEPGGYASLLHVPEGKRRATLLPLDTVEFTWHVTAAE